MTLLRPWVVLTIFWFTYPFVLDMFGLENFISGETEKELGKIEESLRTNPFTNESATTFVSFPMKFVGYITTVLRVHWEALQNLLGMGLYTGEPHVDAFLGLLVISMDFLLAYDFIRFIRSG